MDHGNHGKHGKLLFEEETFRVRAAVFEVSRQLGTGFLEAVYQEALAIEFQDQHIPFVGAPAGGPLGQFRMRAKGARRKASPVIAADLSVFSVFSVAKSSGRDGSL